MISKLNSCVLAVLCFGCVLISRAEAIEILIYNNMPEREPGSKFIIEKARSVETPDNKIRFEVLPGETKQITGGNVQSFVLTRVFPRHKLKYDIKCSPTAKGRFKVTLIEIHDEKLPKGCKVIRRGHWSRRTGVNWDGL